MTCPGIYLQACHRMSCSAYLKGGLIKNKGWVALFQTSQEERLFHYDNQVVLRLIYQSGPSSFPFSLGKNRIYLETQLKGEFTEISIKRARVFTLSVSCDHGVTFVIVQVK